MADPSRDQLLAALRKADAANDTEAARAIARRIADMDEAGGEGFDLSDAPITDDRPLRQALANAAQVTATSAAKAITSPIDLAMDVGGKIQQGITGVATPIIAGGLDLIGADGAADAVRRGGQARQADIGQQTNQLQFRNALEQVLPTPKGFENSALGAEIVAGLGIPFKTARGPVQAPQVGNALASKQPKVIPDAERVIAEGQRRGVPVMTTDVKPPRSAPGRFIKQTVPEKIPVTGTSGIRAEQQAARQQAVQDVVEEFGGRLEVDGLSLNPIEEVTKALSKTRSERLTRLTSAKNGIIDGIDAPFRAAPNTLRAISEEVRTLRGIDEQEFAPVIERLQRFGERLQSGNMTLRQVEENRRLLGDLFQGDNLANIKGAGQKAINRIYEPLRRDMGDFIEATSGKAQRAKWRKANDELAAMIGELEDDAFKKVLKKADITPDNVATILFKGGDRGNESMRRLVSNLDDDGVRKVQGALMTQAWRKAMTPQGVSVEKFLNELGRLSDNFDIAFKGSQREALKGVERLLNVTRRGAEAGANIRTGEQNVPTVLGIGATQAFGLAGGVTTLGVGGLIARLYESAGMRNLLVGLAKTKAGSPAEKAALSRIMKAAAPIINNWQDDLAKVANDNMTAAAVAEDPTE